MTDVHHSSVLKTLLHHISFCTFFQHFNRFWDSCIRNQKEGHFEHMFCRFVNLHTQIWKVQWVKCNNLFFQLLKCIIYSLYPFLNKITLGCVHVTASTWLYSRIFNRINSLIFNCTKEQRASSMIHSMLCSIWTNVHPFVNTVISFANYCLWRFQSVI